MPLETIPCRLLRPLLVLHQRLGARPNLPSRPLDKHRHLLHLATEGGLVLLGSHRRLLRLGMHQDQVRLDRPPNQAPLDRRRHLAHLVPRESRRSVKRPSHQRLDRWRSHRLLGKMQQLPRSHQQLSHRLLARHPPLRQRLGRRLSHPPSDRPHLDRRRNPGR